MRGVIVGLALGLAAPAAAQPWRYEDAQGRTHYTSDVNQLPKERRDRILAAREEARKRRAALPDAGAPPAPPRPTPPRRPPPPRPKPSETEEGAEPTPKEAEAPTVDPAAVVRQLEAELAEARTARDRARRKALEVPSGQAYHARAQAEQKVEALEAALKAAREAAAAD
jgi:hypothetical protein